MSHLFEITGDDIALLNDSDLRNLIGMLCEADYRSAGLPTKDITWGGHQDARDGGLDVVVRGEFLPPRNSFIPRRITGFQVKKPDMPRSQISKEMRPKGVLREEIKNLIQYGGAYIIACSNGSTTERALKERISAMREAVADEENNCNLFIEFYDRGRIATWVRSHPFLILWVREQIGRPLAGWRPYDNWSNPRGGIEENYLHDDGLQVYDGTKSNMKKMAVLDGINSLRSVLSNPGNSIRLVGLSGVGKTRLVQALFDKRLGKNALNPSHAIYTDMSDSPNPEPVYFAQQLISNETISILIVDNCAPDLHRRLTQICSTPESTISVLTVEYDIRDDLPEETKVYTLEAASEKIIEKLILIRFPNISQINAESIARFSSGNARIAIALANTLNQGDEITGLRDEELFERLFRQRNEFNENLIVSAEVCSLVYSFEGTDIKSEGSELNILASLVGKSISEIYRDVETLKDRALIQSRSVWRAVLPHAISNRLAKRALRSIPKDTIVQSFLTCGSERLLLSFTRRLGYLHDDELAIGIVNDWLSPDGWLGKEKCNFNEFGLKVFINIASVSPEKVLEAMECAAYGENGRQFTSSDNVHRYEFVELLRKIAYDGKLFSRSVEVICRFVLFEIQEKKRNSVQEILKSLFYLYLSGTHASIEDRVMTIENLVYSKDENNQEIGLILLEAALEATHFSSDHSFRFGTRSRDFGYRPKTRSDIENWYEAFIRICAYLAISDQPTAEPARKLLAEKFSGLWSNANAFEALEASATQIHEKKAWNEGWLAVKSVIRYERNGFSEEIFNRIKCLENYLRPTDIIEQTRTYCLASRRSNFDLEDDFNHDGDGQIGYDRLMEFIRSIGYQLVQNTGALKILLPEIVSTDNYHLFILGKGLADGSDSKQELWETLYNHYSETPYENRKLSVFVGFLSSLKESEQNLYNSILDKLMIDDLFSEWFPRIQIQTGIDQRGIERLIEALEYGKTDIHTYSYLAYGRVHEVIPDEDLAMILRKIVEYDNGLLIVNDILRMRFYSLPKKQIRDSNELTKLARYVLLLNTLSSNREIPRNLDYDLEIIASNCLSDSTPAHVLCKICQNVTNGIVTNRIFAYDFTILLNIIAKLQPKVFLDCFIGNECIEDHILSGGLMYSIRNDESPLMYIHDDMILEWCDKAPEKRYPLVISTVNLFLWFDEAKEYQCNPIVFSILKNAPDLDLIFKLITNLLWPRTWSGSIADIVEKRLILIEELLNSENPDIRYLANAHYNILKAAIRAEREREKKWNISRNESFE